MQSRTEFIESICHWLREEPGAVIVGGQDTGKTHVLNRISRRFNSDEYLLVRLNPQQQELPLSGVRSLFSRYARHTDGLWDGASVDSALDCFTFAEQLQARLEPRLPLNTYILLDNADLMDVASQQIIIVLATQLMPDRFRIVATACGSVQDTLWASLREAALPPFSLADAEELVLELGRPATNAAVLQTLLTRSDHNPRYFRQQLKEASDGQLAGIDHLTLPLRPSQESTFAQQLAAQNFSAQELEVLSYCALAPVVEKLAVEEIVDGGADIVEDLLTKGHVQHDGSYLRFPSQILRNELYWQQPTKLRRSRQQQLARLTDHYLLRRAHELTVSDASGCPEVFRTAAGLIHQGFINYGIELIENQLSHAGSDKDVLNEFRSIVRGLFERVEMDWACRYLNYVIAQEPSPELTMYMMGFCLDISSLTGSAVDDETVLTTVEQQRVQLPSAAALLLLKLASCMALRFYKDEAKQYLADSQQILAEAGVAPSADYLDRLAFMRNIMIKADDDLVGAQAAYAEWQQQDNAGQHSFVSIALGSALAEVGLFEEARSVIAPMLRKSLPQVPRLTDTLCQIINTEIEFGDQNYVAAIKAVESLILHGSTAQLLSPLPETFIAWYWFEKDHPETARSHIAKAMMAQPRGYSPDQQARMLSLEADYALSFGRIESAEFHLQAAFNTLESTTSATAVRVICSLVEVKVLRGQREEAKAILERIDTDGPFRDKLLSSHRYLRAEAVTRAPEEAVAQLLRILKTSQDQIKEFELGRLHLLLGLARSFLGDVLNAQRDFRVALRLFGSIGAVGWERQAAYLMPSTNPAEAPEVIDNSLLTLLSMEERQIVERVQQGLTNKEIATEMFLSQRTVEHRLTQLFRKLEVRNRTHLLHKLREHNPAMANGHQPR